LKALIWEAEDGNARITYCTAEFLKNRHSIEGKDEVLKMVTHRLATLSDRPPNNRRQPTSACAAVG
jgi:uncharacterized protein (DUF302 family)